MKDKYYKNDTEEITGFRDGQPVYGRGRAAGGERPRNDGRASYGRGERDEGRTASGKTYRGAASGRARHELYHGADAREANAGRGRVFDRPYANGGKVRSRGTKARPYPDRYSPDESRHDRRELQPFGRGEGNVSKGPGGRVGRSDDRTYRRKAYVDERTNGVQAAGFEAPNGAAEGERELPNIIIGRNPVKEAVKSGRSIDRILVTKEHDGSLGEIIGMARGRNLVIRETDRNRLDELSMPFGHNGRPGNHQGIIAEIPGVEYAELDDILDYAETRGEKPFIVLLDGIEDPNNLGSIIRSAECAGAHGVVITKRRSAPVTAAAVKASAGAAEHIRIARVVNLGAAIDTLKSHGIWTAGADMGGKPVYETDVKGSFALVIGSEGNGLSKLVREKCDFLVSVPIKGRVDSLNAAVAAAVIMFEKNRQEGAVR